jgi:hypothetical protein
MRFLPVVLLLPCLLGAAEADALAIDAILQARHVPFGTVLNPIFAAPGSTQIAGYTRCGDSAIWTGHYLAAEAYRYRVTHAPDALANARGALAGITMLVDVTGTNLLARCAVPQDSTYARGIASEEDHNGVHTAAYAGATWIWIGHTSRDQYVGVFFGLATAYDLIPDTAMRAQIAALTTRVVTQLRNWNWNIVLPDGSVSTTFLIRPEQRLAFLQIAKDMNPTQFADAYARDAAGLAVTTALPLGIDASDEKSSYFKFNLDYATLFSLIRLESDAGLRASYEQGYATIRRATSGHGNAHFNMIDRALHGPNTARDAETRAELDAWLKRPRSDVFVDWRGKIAPCGAPNEACSPLAVEQRPPSDFLWQLDPFQLSGGGGGVIETAGIDYLLPYWMARYYRVVAGPVARAPRRR